MKTTVQTSRGPVRFHSAGEPIAGIPSIRSELAVAADLLMGVSCQPSDELPDILRERLRAVALSAYSALARAKGVQS